MKKILILMGSPKKNGRTAATVGMKKYCFRLTVGMTAVEVKKPHPRPADKVPCGGTLPDFGRRC